MIVEINSLCAVKRFHQSNIEKSSAWSKIVYKENNVLFYYLTLLSHTIEQQQIIG